MKRILQLTLVTVIIAALAACGQNQADPNSASAAPDKPGLLSGLTKPEAPKITIPEGTRLHIALIDGVSSEKSSPGDQFTASLTEPVVVNGTTVLEKGAKVRGRVTDSKESGRVKGRASIRLTLTEVVHNGKNVAISTKPFVAVAQGTKKRDAMIIGGGTGVGALIGGIAGGGKGAAIGAAVGAGGGTGTVLATKGKEIHYPPETRITFTLSQSVMM